MGDEANAMPGRRRTLTWLAGALLAPEALAQGTSSSPPITHHPSPITRFSQVVPGYRMSFPRDEGSHPEFRIEWWYVTGWLDEATRPLGFQVTFFRVRPDLAQENPSAFSPRHVLIAHAAISDPARDRLLHEQRAARAGFGLAGANEGRAEVWIDDWRLRRDGAFYLAQIPGRALALDLRFEVTQPPLKQGQDGYSRKGPAPASASYYYSLPHLHVSGTAARGGKPRKVTGTAWLDHEWSSNYLEPAAAGWDWIGINLQGGGALTAFRIRDRKHGRLWAGGSLRLNDGRVQAYAPDEVQFIARRQWQSARTGVRYPVSFSVTVGNREFTIEPLFDDQEHDTRASTGAIYWEGAVRAHAQGSLVGHGYLELTGYAKPLAI